jgi:hypothetical protein
MYHEYAVFYESYLEVLTALVFVVVGRVVLALLGGVPRGALDQSAEARRRRPTRVLREQATVIIRQIIATLTALTYSKEEMVLLRTGMGLPDLALASAGPGSDICELTCSPRRLGRRTNGEPHLKRGNMAMHSYVGRRVTIMPINSRYVRIPFSSSGYITNF